jgi:hypothetical protein
MTMTSHRLHSPMPAFDPLSGIVVKEPERAEAGYWVGCPGVLYEPDKRRFLMTYRERRPRGADPEHGWRCALARSEDGVHFTDVWEVHKDELGTSSMERFSVVPAPGGGYDLYISYVDPADNRWRVDVLRADTPDGFAIATARPVLTAASTGTEGVKDPYVLRAGPVTYLFASYAAARPFSPGERRLAHGSADIYNVGLTTHPTGLATGLDGAGFTWHGGVLGVGDGWDRYQARLNCVLPTPAGFFGLYDGSASAGENYEERCGVAVCADLRDWRSLTPDRPWITTPNATGSVRYVDVVPVGDQWWIYYETTRPDGAHELRLSKVPAV